MAAPIARDTLRSELQATEHQGAAVHTFSADATPEQKAAAAGKAKSKLSSVTDGVNANGEARELSIATGTGPQPKTTVTPDEIAKVNKEEAQGAGAANGQPPPNVGGAYKIPEDYKVGWRANVLQLDEKGQKKPTLLEQYIPEEYFGPWYANGGVIFFAVVSTYFLTLFRLGWGWLIIVLATCATHYGVSMERTRRAIRDDINRELIKTRLATEHESADWINNFLDRFWLIYEPVLSATIISSVDQILSVSAPPFLDSIRLSTFTLGTKAPRIEKVRTYPRTAEEEVLMEWGLSFTSTETTDLTPTQLASKTSSKIVLEIKFGKGPARVTMPILVENIEFSGLMRIKLNLMSNFPHVKTVDLSFMEKPLFSYALKPIGGETFGFDINVIPGLQSFIRDTVHSILGPMMYDPNVFTLNLEQLLSGTPLDTAVGVLQIKVISARGLKGVKFGGGTPDPYVSISMSSRAELTRTKFKKSTYNPHWDSTHYVLLTESNLTEPLTLSIMDHNDRTKDTLLGVASFDLASLLEDATQDNIVTKIVREGKECGEVVYNLAYHPVLKPKTLDGGVVEPVPDTQVGIVRLTVHQAKELDVSKSMSKDINPLAKILIGSKVFHRTPTYKHTVQPIWESASEHLITDKENARITVNIIDDRDIRKDPTIGHLVVRLTDLLKAKEAARDWFPLSGCKSGRVRVSAEWKPLNMPGSVQGAAAYHPPIGVIRLWIKKATEVKNVEATLGGKSDPYLRVMRKGITMARTEVINNNLNPEWDQIIYAPVHALSDSLVLETMDYQHMTRDRSLGYVELYVKDLAKSNVDDPKYPFESLGKVEKQEPIRLQGNTYKGKLHYAAEFIPAFNLRGVSFDAVPGSGLPDAGADTATDVASGDEDSVSSSDEEAQAVPTELTIKGLPPSDGKLNGHTKNAKSTDTTASVDDKASIKTANTRKTASTIPDATSPITPKEVGGIELSEEELFKHQTGVLVVHAVSGDLVKKASLQLLIDDGYWPSFSTERAVSTKATWDQVGEGFIKELDFSNVWLRLNEDEENVKDEIIGEIKMSGKAFLDECWNKRGEFKLLNATGATTGTIVLSAKWVPVPVQIEARESINNMGSLRVQVISASNLRAADRGGKSDPYAVFSLNGQKVFKSETKKKTVNPVWDQSFEALVPSRVAANFEVEIFDWDQVGTADELGSAKIDLAGIEPLEAIDLNLPLTHPKHGQKGDIKLQLVFSPQIVARSRKATSTFASAGRAMTQVGSIPFGLVGGVAHGVGHAGTKVTKGLFGKKKETIAEEDEKGYSVAETIPVPSIPPAGQVSQPAAGVSPTSNGHLTAFPTSNTTAMQGEGSAPSNSGSLKVLVIGAKDLGGGDGVKPYVQLKIGKKDHETKRCKGPTPEWNESTSFNVGPNVQSMFAGVYDHKTLGKDKLLGEAEVDIWRHIQLGGGTPITSADVWVELTNGQGLLQLRLDFESGGPGGPSRTSTSVETSSVSGGGSGLRTPLGSPSRFSLTKRNPDSPTT